MLYPIDTETRGLFNLNGIWNFKIDKGNGFDEEWYEKKLTDTLIMSVPASYNDLAINEVIRNHIGWVWYEREFTIPDYLFNERLVLRFGSATHFAKVYINGKFVTEHKGGFLPFEAEINKYIQKGKNRVTVAVNNIVDHTTLPVGSMEEFEFDGVKTIQNKPRFDFYNYAGLNRPVKIYSTPKTYVEDVTVLTDFNGNTGVVNYDLEIVGDYDEVQVSIFDEEHSQKAAIKGRKNELLIHDVNLWKPMDAFLYTLKVDVLKDDEIIDTYDLPFGVRTVSVEDGKFLINNKPFYFKGFGKHEDSPINGRGFNEAANVMDFNLMKWTGANSFRTSHYPYSEELMRLADQMGFVVIDETPAVGLNYDLHSVPSDKTAWEDVETFDHHKDVIKDYIARDKNHPSVVMWSIANEPSSELDGAYEYFEPLVKLTRESDPQNRPVTIVTYAGSRPDTDKVAELIDVLAFNRYYGWYSTPGDLETGGKMLLKEFEQWEERCPNKPIMMTEYGPDTITGLHDIHDELFTEEFQIKYFKTYHEVFDKHKLFIGEQVWNFADFATDQSIRRVQGNKKGVFTRERKPKNAAFALKKRWESIPNFNYKK
jgi:beta-glucuronidase